MTPIVRLYSNYKLRSINLNWSLYKHVYVMHQSMPTVPNPPPPPLPIRELGLFENTLANAPPPGQNSFLNTPGWLQTVQWLKNVLFSLFLVLLSVKSKLNSGQIKSWLGLVSSS